MKWGFQAMRNLRPGEKLHEWFKLGLDPELEDGRASASDLLQKFPSKTALPPTKGELYKKFVVDYLTSLKVATDNYFKKTFDRVVYEVPREYIITVPAMWSETAQDATRSCAAEAFLGEQNKIDEIQIIAEPEAAGIYAFTTMSKIGLQEGDTFVICDAGGG